MGAGQGVTGKITAPYDKEPGRKAQAPPLLRRLLAASIANPEMELLPAAAVGRVSRLAEVMLRARHVACLDTYAQVRRRGVTVVLDPTRRSRGGARPIRPSTKGSGPGGYWVVVCTTAESSETQSPGEMTGWRRGTASEGCRATSGVAVVVVGMCDHMGASGTQEVLVEPPSTSPSPHPASHHPLLTQARSRALDMLLALVGLDPSALGLAAPGAGGGGGRGGAGSGASMGGGGGGLALQLQSADQLQRLVGGRERVVCMVWVRGWIDGSRVVTVRQCTCCLFPV